MKTLIVNFEDSFTYNFAELCQKWKISHYVIPFSELSLDFILEKNPLSIVWGPGPGHPDEYEKVFPIIQFLFDKKSIYQIGICLGHQLLMQAQGFKVIEAPLKRHGRTGTFKIPDWPEFPRDYYGRKVQVQYYSSLGVLAEDELKTGVEVVIENGLITSSKGANCLSFQFHPESVGTSCPELFFHKWRKDLL